MCFYKLINKICLYRRGDVIKPWTIKVVAGNVLLQGSSRTHEERDVQKIIIHEDFDDYTLENDIALLEVCRDSDT